MFLLNAIVLRAQISPSGKLTSNIGMLKVGNMGYPRFGTTLELLPNESHDNPMLTTTIEKLPPNECLGCPYSATILKLSPIEELGSPG
ncbi:hypothetical protein V6N13_108980 [Hibiscus sabdariffa]